MFDRSFNSRLAALCTVSLLLTVFAPHGTVARAEAPSVACPLTTASQWQAFLERAADNPKWTINCEDEPCDQTFIERFVRTEVQGTFDKCADFLSKSDALSKCTANLRKFTPTWIKQHDQTSYGFEQDNKTYFAAQETADKPAGMMTPPQAFVDAYPDKARVEQAARENGWKYLTHDSCLVGVRTFLLISDPQGRFDQWMLINFNRKKDVNDVNTSEPVSFLAVQKKDASGRKLKRNKLHFRDYFVAPAGIEKNPGKGTYRFQVRETANGKCYSCHVSGPRTLIARRTAATTAAPVKGEPGYAAHVTTSSREYGVKRLAEFNELIESYGPPDWDKSIKVENHGPALGEAQGCLNCHDGVQRGRLTVNHSMGQIGLKVYDELAMPPEEGIQPILERHFLKLPLTDSERKTLDEASHAHESIAEAFADARFPTLKAWMLETPCR